MVSETQHKVDHYYPDARVYFLDEKWTGSGKLRENQKIIAPDISDIISINVSLNITNSPGTFTIVLNNKTEKYFIKDDLDFEIKNLNDPPLNIYGKNPRPKYPFKNALEWLNHEEFERLFMLSDGSLATLERYQNKNDGDIGYWERARTAKWLEEHNKEPIEKVDTFKKLSGKDLDNVTKNMRPNLDLYEKYEGMIDYGRCMFKPMNKVVVLFSRRFKNEKLPYDFIVAFTGIVNSVSDDYTENYSKLTISGEDVSKWLKVTWANVNPSILTQGLPDAGEQTQRTWTKRFTHMEPWEIIKLFILGGTDAEGIKVRGVGDFEFNPMLGPYSSVVATRGMKKVLTPTTFANTDEGIVETEDESDLDRLFQKSRLHIQIPVDKLEYTDTGELKRTPYKRFTKDSFDTFENEWKTHLEVLYEIAKTSNFEFYADQNGDIWYHQPRFNNYHILTSEIPEVYIIQTEDIISSNLTESDEPVVTSVLVIGQKDLIDIDPYILNLVNFYEDPGLILKYGRRMITVSHPFVRTSSDCYYYAQSLLFRTLGERRTGTVTIVGRPEIRMAMPVYIPYRNMIYYVNSITHDFSFGGTFSTTLGLTYGRKPWEPLPELLAYSAHASSDGEVGKRNIVTESTAVHQAVDKKASTDDPTMWPFGVPASYYHKIETDYPGSEKTHTNLTTGEEESLPPGIDLLSQNQYKIPIVLATHKGKVKEVGGDYIIIESSGGNYETYYYGVEIHDLLIGDEVVAGTTIGDVVSGESIRYCMKRKDSGFVNPEIYTSESLTVRGGGAKS